VGSTSRPGWAANSQGSRQRRKTPHRVAASYGCLPASCVDCRGRGRTAALVLGPAAYKARGLSRAPDRLSGAAKTRGLGPVIDQTVERPQENGRPKRRGRRRTAVSRSALSAAVICAGRPGRGASCPPSRPSARERWSQRSPVASRSRPTRAICATLSPGAAASNTLWARVRSRGVLVVRDRRSSCSCCVGVNGGLWLGLRPPVYHHSSTLGCT
jgi:hypothetical protein